MDFVGSAPPGRGRHGNVRVSPASCDTQRAEDKRKPGWICLCTVMMFGLFTCNLRPTHHVMRRGITRKSQSVIYQTRRRRQVHLSPIFLAKKQNVAMITATANEELEL